MPNVYHLNYVREKISVKQGQKSVDRGRYFTGNCWGLNRVRANVSDKTRNKPPNNIAAGMRMRWSEPTSKRIK